MKRTAKRLIPMSAGVYLLLANVQTDYDHKATFGQYKSYPWISAKAAMISGRTESRKQWMGSSPPGAGRG